MSTQAKTKIEYQDVPAVNETFADTVHAIAYDGQTFRVEFCVTRMDDAGEDGARSGKRRTACRMVLSPNAALELSAKLSRVLGAVASRSRQTAEPARAAKPN